MPDEIPNAAPAAAPTNTTPPAGGAPAAPKPGEPPRGAAPAGTPPAADPAKPPPKADAWAALAQKERTIAAREAATKKAETDLAAREASLADGGTKAERARIKKLAEEGRFDELETEFGISYQQWTRAKLAKGGAKAPAPGSAAALTPEAVAKLVADGIKADREAQAQTSAKEREEAEAVHWQKTMGTVGEMVKSGGDKLSILASEIAEEPERIEKALRDLATMDPTIKVDVALDKIEEYFLKRTANLVRSSPKLQALLGLSSANPATGAPPKNEQQSSPRERTGHEASGDGPRTLTNVLAADSTSSAAPERPLSKGAQIAAQRREDAARIGRIAAKLPQG